MLVIGGPEPSGVAPAQGTTPSAIQIEAGPQVYFEEGERRVPPTFDPTPEERKG